MFDIVMLIGNVDVDTIYHQLECTRKNVIGYRNIYYIPQNDELELEGCIKINEDIFPFSANEIKEYLNLRKDKRAGWYFQQLAKLYSGSLIHGILPRYLVLDADVFFTKPTTFIEDDKCLYAYGTEHHLPYFKHMNLMHDSLFRNDMDVSGICHHMMFENKYLNELFDMIESKHDKSFYMAFLDCIKVMPGRRYFASEFEIYFNFMFNNHRDEISIRKLNWENFTKRDYLQFEELKKIDYDFLSFHCHEVEKVNLI